MPNCDIKCAGVWLVITWALHSEPQTDGKQWECWQDHHRIQMIHKKSNHFIFIFLQSTQHLVHQIYLVNCVFFQVDEGLSFSHVHWPLMLLWKSFSGFDVRWWKGLFLFFIDQDVVVVLLDAVIGTFVLLDVIIGTNQLFGSLLAYLVQNLEIVCCEHKHWQGFIDLSLFLWLLLLEMNASWLSI